MTGDIEKLLLRLGIGGGLLTHGLQKISHGTAHIEKLLHMHNLPEWLAYGVYIGEVIAPVALILGLKARIAAGVVALNMLFAIILAYGGGLFALKSGGGFASETALLYLLGALAVAVGGGGRIGIRW